MEDLIRLSYEVVTYNLYLHLCLYKLWTDWYGLGGSI